jgi:hypothetical protein
VAIQEKMPGPEHPDLNTILGNLATLYDVQHQYAKAEPQYAKAEPLYQRALATLEKVRGPEHPDMVLILENYSLYWAFFVSISCRGFPMDNQRRVLEYISMDPHASRLGADHFRDCRSHRSSPQRVRR